MNEPTSSAGQLPGRETAADGRTLPRLRLPFVSLLVFWILSVVVARLNKPYFVGFMYGLLATGLITLLFFGWWWFNRGLRFWEKCAGFVLLVGEAVLVGMFTHRSVNGFTLWITGLPIVASVIVAWIFFVKKFHLRWRRLGFVAVVTGVWSCFLLIRTEGADATLKVAMHWRWTPTLEERFLALSKSGAPAPLRQTATAPGMTKPATNDWTGFRGPARDGVIMASSIATNWTRNPPSLLWKRPVGPAWSSLLVVGSRVYTQEQRGDQEAVVCYDAAKGEQLWAHEDKARFEESVSGPGPRATPTFANGRLFSVGGTGQLNCLDADTGKVLWSRDMKEASGAKVPMWAFVSSPLVTDDLVIVYAGGEAGKGLLAYRLQSGELAWTAPAGTSSYSSPQVTCVAGTPQCLILHDSGLTAVELATGKKLWETGVIMKGAPRCGQPRLVDGNKLLVGALGGLGCSLVEVAKNGDGWAVTNKWDSKELKPEFPDFVVCDEYAYGFDIGIFCCLRLADGKRTWKEGRYGRGQVMLLRDQGLLLVSSETGELVLLATDPKEHRELARFQALEGKTWNHPVVVNDRVYLRNGQEMACYSIPSQ
jgi:outer membrane protein assembly factor BamB